MTTQSIAGLALPKVLRHGREADTGTDSPDHTYTVYTLVRQDTGQAIYVGCSRRPQQRWALHKQSAKHSPDVPPVARELARLMQLGVGVTLTLMLEGLSRDEAKMAEVRMVNELQAQGAPLCNQNLFDDLGASAPRPRGVGSDASRRANSRWMADPENRAQQRASGRVNQLQHGAVMTRGLLDQLVAGGEFYVERARAVLTLQDRDFDRERQLLPSIGLVPMLQAAEALGAPYHLIQRLVRERDLASTQHGQKILVDLAEARRALEAHNKALEAHNKALPQSPEEKATLQLARVHFRYLEAGGRLTTRKREVLTAAGGDWLARAETLTAEREAKAEAEEKAETEARAEAQTRLVEAQTRLVEAQAEAAAQAQAEARRLGWVLREEKFNEAQVFFGSLPAQSAFNLASQFKHAVKQHGFAKLHRSEKLRLRPFSPDERRARAYASNVLARLRYGERLTATMQATLESAGEDYVARADAIIVARQSEAA